MNCTAAQTLLTLHVLNDLDAATAATVRSHIDTCPDCRAALRDIDSTLDLLHAALAVPTAAPAQLPATHRARILAPRRGAAPLVIKGDSWFTRHHRGFAAAAALLFICGMIGLLMPSLSSSRHQALTTQAMMMESMEEVDGEEVVLEKSLDLYAALPAASAPQGEVNGVSVGGRVSEAKPESRAFYGFAAKKPGWFARRSARDGDESVRLGLDLDAPQKPAPAPELDSTTISGELVRTEPEIRAGADNKPEFTRLHDISRAEARGTMESRYHGALAERRDQLSTELRMLEAGAASPNKTTGSSSDRVGEIGVADSGLSGELSTANRERHAALTAQLEAVEAAEYKWQAKNLLAPVVPPPPASPAPPMNVSGTYNQLARADNSVGDKFYALGPAEAPAQTQPESRRERAARKLEEIRIPEVDFRNANLSDVVDFFKSSTEAFDGGEGREKTKMDLSFGYSAGVPGSSVAAATDDPFGGNEGSDGVADKSESDPFADTSTVGGKPAEGEAARITFSAKDISAKEALKIVTDIANLKYRITDEGGVTIVPKNAPDGDVVVREYEVAPLLKQRLEAEQKKSNERPSGDFIAIEAGARDSDGDGLKNLLNGQEVAWPAGSSVKYLPSLGKMVVANTEQNLAVVEQKLAELAREEDRKREAEAAAAEHERLLEEEKRLRFTAHGVNPFVAAAVEAFSTFGIDVDTASYTLTRNRMAQGTLPPAEAVRTEEFVNAFDYDYVAPSRGTFRIYTELAPSPFGRDLQMLKIGVKGRRLGREEQRPAVLTFLVDTSGSMNAPERIGLVQTSLKLLVEHLSPNDQVALIQYDSHARLLLEHTPASQKVQILRAIDQMQCTGSTNLEEGMNEAYRLAADAFVGGAENRVLLLSDGVANLGSMAAEDILKKVEAYRKQGIFCSVFGVGSGSYDDTMLETLANKGDGVYTFLDSAEQARRVFVDDLAATLNTIASDVKIQVEFDPALVKQYRQLGYENRRLRKEDFRNDAVDAGEVGSGQSVTALYELELSPQLLARPQGGILPPHKLATVRVRYRRIDTGRIEEIERAVVPNDGVGDVREAGNGFRLAAAVAEFAEILRGSPYARGSRYEDVAALLRPIALELHLDERVQELLRLVMAAESTPRGE